jgi:hypothetical protein
MLQREVFIIIIIIIITLLLLLLLLLKKKIADLLVSQVMPARPCSKAKLEAR